MLSHNKEATTETPSETLTLFPTPLINYSQIRQQHRDPVLVDVWARLLQNMAPQPAKSLWYHVEDGHPHNPTTHCGW